MAVNLQLLPLMLATLLLGGMGVALLGTVKVPLARRLQIDEAKVGGLVSLFGFVLIPVILSAGFLTDSAEFGGAAVMIAGSLLFASGLLGLGLAGNYRTALASVVLLSAGWALMINVGNVLTPATFTRSKAFATNLANVFFGLGAFLTPLALTWLLVKTPFARGLCILAGLALLPAVLSLTVDFAAAQGDPSPEADTGAGPGLDVLLSNPILWLCGAALFFYGPLEASMAAWTTTYLSEKGVDEKTASRLLSSFWLAFMAARLLTALILPIGGEVVFIPMLGLASVGVMWGVAACRSSGTAKALVPAAGLVFGPIFPTILAVLLDHVDRSLHGRAVGFFFAIGGIGWTAIPLLIGRYARQTSLQRGFAIALAAAVALALVTAAISLALAL